MKTLHYLYYQWIDINIYFLCNITVGVTPVYYAFFIYNSVYTNKNLKISFSEYQINKSK
jgi:hypothetical protein